ncbi:hypothetical protein HWV62_20618 [Athelia sp. TMB]|nr:hypothetical protein HWV62_20618 [Athelia sp. TMB]
MDLDNFEIDDSGDRLIEATSYTSSEALQYLDNVWYTQANRRARWMDLIGDYAGSERFIIDDYLCRQRTDRRTVGILSAPTRLAAVGIAVLTTQPGTDCLLLPANESLERADQTQTQVVRPSLILPLPASLIRQSRRARALASALAALVGALTCRPRPPSPEPPRAPSLASQRADDLPSYTSARPDMAQLPAPAPYSTTAPARSSTTVHSATPTAVAVPPPHPRTRRPGTAQSTASQQGRRIAGGPNTRVGVRPGTAQSTASRRPGTAQSTGMGTGARPGTAQSGTGMGTGARPGTAMSQASLLDARSTHSTRTRGAGLPPADRAFLDALADAELPQPEIARIATLLAVGPPAERALPPVLLASVPDFGEGERAFLGRMWACGVGVAEISRVVEVVREQRAERGEGGGGVMGPGGAGSLGGLAAPPGYAP